MSRDNKATEEMKRLLEQFMPVRLEYERLVGAKKGRMVIGGATSAKAIASREKALQFQFPASYHAFLSMHNGWLSFWPDWSVYGVEGNPTDRMERDVKKRIKWYDDAIEHNAAYEDKDSKEALAQAREKDRRSKSAVYMPHHPVVATDFNGSLMVFDRHRVGKDGETALVIFRYADVEGGYRSFTHFVEAALKDARSEVEGLRRKKPRN